MSYTVASLLREKTSNMATWLRNEGLPTELQLAQFSDIELVTFAHTLRNDYSDCIKARDFFTDREIPSEVSQVVQFIERRPSLHDKFWRYLQLFSEVVNTYEH